MCLRACTLTQPFPNFSSSFQHVVSKWISAHSNEIELWQNNNSEKALVAQLIHQLTHAPPLLPAFQIKKKSNFQENAVQECHYNKHGLISHISTRGIVKWCYTESVCWWLWVFQQPFPPVGSHRGTHGLLWRATGKIIILKVTDIICVTPKHRWNH